MGIARRRSSRNRRHKAVLLMGKFSRISFMSSRESAVVSLILAGWPVLSRSEGRELSERPAYLQCCHPDAERSRVGHIFAAKINRFLFGARFTLGCANFSRLRSGPVDSLQRRTPAFRRRWIAKPVREFPNLRPPAQLRNTKSFDLASTAPENEVCGDTLRTRPSAMYESRSASTPFFSAL